MAGMIRVVAVVVVALAFPAQAVHAMIGKDGPGDVRVSGVCGTGAKRS